MGPGSTLSTYVHTAALRLLRRSLVDERRKTTRKSVLCLSGRSFNGNKVAGSSVQALG